MKDQYTFLTEGKSAEKDSSSIETHFIKAEKTLWGNISKIKNSEQSDCNISTHVDQLSNILIDFYVADVLLHLNSTDQAKLCKEYGELIQTLIQQLNSWIGDVINTQNMANTNRIQKKSVIESLYPTAQASREIFERSSSYHMITNGINLPINVSKNAKCRKEIFTYVSININALKQQGVSMRHLTPFDEVIHNAVCSIYKAGNTWITYGEVFRVLCGNNSKKHMSTLMKKKIAESVFKLGLTWVKIDASAEVEAKLLPQDCGNIVDPNDPNGKAIMHGKYGGYLLPLNTAEIIINGQVVTDGFRIIADPLLFMYAENKNQIASADIKLRNIPIPTNSDSKTTLETTEENVVLVDYLLERVLAAKNQNNHMGNTILYETIYKRLGILSKASYQEYSQEEKEAMANLDIQIIDTKAYRNKCLQIRQKVRFILNYWTNCKECEDDVSSFIKGYKEVKEKNIVKKIIILL